MVLSLVMFFLHAQTITYLLFPANNILWQRVSNAKKDERSPLPSEWIDCHAEDKPVRQLRVREEVERTSRRMSL